MYTFHMSKSKNSLSLNKEIREEKNESFKSNLQI